MSDEPSIDLRFIGRSLKSVNDRLGALDDNKTVLTAMVIRMDGTMTGLVTESRAIHSLENVAQASAAP